MKLKLYSVFHCRRGQALVEMAIVLPLLVLLLLGVYDFSKAIQAKNIIANVSREGANMAARTSFAANDIMNTVGDTAQPLDLQHNGMMYITTIEGSTSIPSGTACTTCTTPTTYYLYIHNQTPWSNAASSMSTLATSRLGSPSSPKLSGFCNLNLSNGQTAQVFEIFYKYQSMFGINSKMLPSIYYSMSVF